MRIDPDYYREKAEQTEMLIDRVTDDETKTYLRTVAGEYERLAT